jgi:phosphate transport system permease protein
MGLVYFTGLALLTLVGYFFGRSRAAAAARVEPLHSRPAYHGAFVAIAVLGPLLLLFAIAVPVVDRIVENRSLTAFDPTVLEDPLRRGAAVRDIEAVATNRYSGEPTPALRSAAETYGSVRSFTNQVILGTGLVFGLLGIAFGLRALSSSFRARNHVERVVKSVLFAAACVAVLTTIGIVCSVLFETVRFFERVSPLDFLFGTQWSPQTAIRADQVGSSGSFGIVPLVTGTLLITVIAMLIAGPIGLFAAIYLAEYAGPRFRSVAKPFLEVLAGIPTVVLGFFAALTLAPWIRETGQTLGLNVASESALAAGVVMGMMIIPFVSSLSDDVINAVPQSLRDGSYAMGATKSETIKKVVLPAAFSGIVSAFMLAISRAVGETMIVVMAAGLAANLTFNPLEAVTTFTVQIKTILVGDQEFDSAKTLSAFALGFVLFFFTLTLNVIALQIVKRYREQYD